MTDTVTICLGVDHRQVEGSVLCRAAADFYLSAIARRPSSQYLNIALHCVVNTEKKEDNPIKNNRVVLILVTSYYIILELQEFLMMQIIKLLPSRHPI